MSRKTLILLLILLFIAIIIVFAYIKRDKLKAWFNKANGTGNTADNNNNGNNGNGNNTNQNVPSEFPLKLGSNNGYVTQLQNYLLSKNQNCLPKYEADGDWGAETEACVNSVLNTDVVSYTLYKSLGLV